ncbi:hypothetical protein MUZ84_004324 [Salmonella enterica]|uniref:Uncharacterized protein n=1 Tax=Salmonella enterica TaxID=28901 RepID=A0A763STU1_SALER|nr:hypothetical protein [Salmonella enterica]EBG2396331.1 hypothetical protein [Salmonella enterica subsp. enterica serovar Everleigh]ECB5043938.1 hypothetical protein [Salmonella enterica subsp. enterica serovar Teshie]ECD6620716.1 hypothetical protein [Salmonella enterica subsp. enterica]EDN7243326.1 hypothetical protein [Salmonella enterica subsp. enterica serovar Thompson]EDR6298190.1 hypothetical protein [Salmonella enterica subsp. enterica serovar Berkeley]EDU0501874.1 hypothetical prot
MRNRISTGFHRIGILLAVIEFVLGVLLTVPHHSDFFPAGSPVVAGVHLSQILGVIFSFVIAVIIYAFIRTIGWVVNGFAGKSEPPDNHHD